MCGFVGVVRDPALGPVTREELAALLPDLHHRGPDGSGIVVGHGVGLAATRLAIQGDRRGDQPVVAPSGRVAVAFNGELFARAQDALRRSLVADQVPVPEERAGDTALLATAFEHALAWDDSCVGPTSQAAWDAVGGSMGAVAVVDLERGRAWVGRDRLGVKPLHQLLPESEFQSWFASTLTPLLRARRGLDKDSAPDLGGLAELWQVQLPSTCLPLAGIRDVRPGTAVRVGQVLPTERTAVGVLRSGRTSAPHALHARERFKVALTRSAGEAADVAGPVALFLSGGLDSAAVAAFCGRRDVLAITGRFDPAGGEFDESAQAAEVAEALGLRHDIVHLYDANLVDDLESVVRALEVPLAGPGSLALWRLAGRARAHGRVVLTGTGGDEPLGGYARSALALGRQGPWTVGYEALARRMPAGEPPAVRSLAALDRRADLEGLFTAEFRAQLEQGREDAEGEDFFNGLVGDAVSCEASPGLPSPLDEVLALECSLTLRALLHVEDRVLMAHGVEGRPVFCLGDVPDSALALHPDDVIGPDGEGKVALRAILKGRIPESVRMDKRKRGFPTPFGRAARGAGRDRAEALLGDRRFRERGWWDVKACRALLDEERPLHDRSLFALLAWETWARLFVDGDAWRAPASPLAAPGAPGR